MSRIIFIIAAALSVGLSAAQAVQANMSAPEKLVEQIPELMRNARISGLAIAKVEKGEIAWHAAFGERTASEPLTIDTLFNAASLTKPVFATMSLHLVADGALQLDEPLHKYWVDPDVADDPRHRALTALTILSHQSGLPNWRGNRQLAFMFEPGARHEYSGEGYEYLRRAIGEITQDSLPSLIQRHVFAPAGMQHSAMGWTDKLGDRIAAGFDEAGEPIDTAIRQKKPNAAAHLMTTVDDYAHFISWVARGAGLPAPLFSQMQQPQALHDDPAERFGLGWKLIPLDGTEILMHDGREPGVRTYAALNTETAEGLVILTNSSNGDLSFRPLINAALSYGQQLTQSADRLVWDYLMHLPPQALIPMSRGIASSPAYLSTLLHAVNTSLIQTSPLTSEEKRAARKAIEPYIFARLENDVKAQQAEKLIEQLLVQEGQGMRLVNGFDMSQARRWLDTLRDI